MCSCSLVCTLYAVCMHPQLHTFSASQPYGHAYSRFCMHCMQSFSELCSRIACIVGFLMHTMHTSCQGWWIYVRSCDSRKLKQHLCLFANQEVSRSIYHSGKRRRNVLQVGSPDSSMRLIARSWDSSVSLMLKALLDQG